MTKYQRNSILCPNCRKLVRTDAPICPYCNTVRPGSWLKNNILTQYKLLRIDDIIRIIIIVNVIMYILSILIDPKRIQITMNPLNMLSPSTGSLILLGATGTHPIDHYHRWWSLVSAGFLHGGILHIFFNMIALKQIGPLIAKEYGLYRMITLYILTSIIGFILSYVAGVTLTIGASAAICGLVGAALYYGKSRGGSYGQMVYSQLSGWVILLFIFGLLIPGINNWAHGGGLVAGWGLGYFLSYQERQRETLYHKWIAGFCVVGTLLILLWAILTSVLLILMG